VRKVVAAIFAHYHGVPVESITDETACGDWWDEIGLAVAMQCPCEIGIRTSANATVGEVVKDVLD
jgi:hypothetical protein